ncbi:MAG: hypothetical protein OEZ13_10225 [Spirochaetia bacterium]|nr:hypothetical protein [Spirochaetia bacterium]
MNKKVKRIYNYSAFILAFLSLYMSSSLAAAQIEAGENVTIDNYVSDDIYAAGGQISVKGAVKEDANLAGGEISVYSNIGGDLNIAGGNVKVLANVSDDIHIAGGQVTIAERIGGDVFIGAGDIFIDKTARIAGSVYIGGGNIKIYGDIDGPVQISGGKILIAGNLKNSLKLSAAETEISGKIAGKAIISSEELQINKDARFHSSVEYWSDEQTDFGKSVLKGKAVYSAKLEPEFHTPWKFMIFFTLLTFLSGLFTIYILNRFFEDFLEESAEYMQENFITGFGTGVLCFLLIPALIFILTIAFITIPFAVVFACLFIILLIFARPITAIMLAQWLQKKLNKEWSKTEMLFISFGIFLLLLFISFIPIVGWLLSAVILAAATGSALQIMWQKKSA